jgi:hypothetical protein
MHIVARVGGTITPVVLPLPHGFDLFGLGGNNILAKLPYLVVLCAGFGEFCHVDRALMMGDHHGHEVFVKGITGTTHQITRHVIHGHAHVPSTIIFHLGSPHTHHPHQTLIVVIDGQNGNAARNNNTSQQSDNSDINRFFV